MYLRKLAAKQDHYEKSEISLNGDRRYQGGGE
jgi:hypothetical protein